MSYSEMLTKIVQESGLSLREIADRCKDKGHSINASYISKLQTGKQTSASEEVSRAIAEVCGGNSDLLVWKGYLDKAPEIIRQYVDATLPQVKESITQVFKFMFPPDQQAILEQTMETLSPIDFIKMLSENTSSDLEIDSSLNFSSKEEGFELRASEIIGIPIIDDSMEPTIPFKSVVRFEKTEEYPDNGTMVVLRLEDKVYIRRWYLLDDHISLVPENLKKYNPVCTNINDITILGKVISFTVKI